MRYSLLTKRIGAILFFTLLILPGSLLIRPGRAHAVLGVADTVIEVGNVAPNNLIDQLKNAITSAESVVTGGATYESYIKSYVLDPLAHALAQAVLKSITASVVNAINGTNGQSQFVTNLAGNLQKTGDQVGLSFIAQFGSSINSPFAPAISNALRSNYLQSTSLAGFFAANQCTLNSSSSNINSYLAGNFNQGGWSAWFSLTTQDQNNPFTLYQKAAGQLASSVTGAQANQRQTIAQNNGFLSWCSSGSSESNTSSIGKSCTDFANSSDCSGTAVCIQTGTGTTGTCQAPTAATSNDTASTCYNKDGTPGTVETPGSVIESSLNKALGSGIDSLVSVHDFDQMVDTILSALVTKVVSTGLSALSGGGASDTNSYTSQLANSPDTNTSGISAQASSLVQSATTQVASYTSAWQSVSASAQTASSTLQALASSCAPQANAAQTALLTEVQPVLNQAQAAATSAAATRALIQKVQADITAFGNNSAGANGALAADTQALAAAPPTAVDIANAQAAANSTGSAAASPSGSLTVSGGSLLDEMNLITTNAGSLKALCGLPVL